MGGRACPQFAGGELKPTESFEQAFRGRARPRCRGSVGELADELASPRFGTALREYDRVVRAATITEDVCERVSGGGHEQAW